MGREITVYAIIVRTDLRYKIPKYSPKFSITIKKYIKV